MGVTMATYECKIGTDDGRIIHKHYQSDSRAQLTESLVEQGFHVFQVRRRLLPSLSGAQTFSTRLSGQRLVTFNQELLVLLRSGLPILKIFDTLIEQMEPGSFRDIAHEIREEIKGGSSLSNAFEKFPRIFTPLYIAALRAGERTGDLPETISRYLEYQKRVEGIRSKVRSASFYPLLLTSAAVIVICFLMIYVVPRFSQIYADANVQLPLMTRILITLSDAIGHYWYLVLALAAGIILAAQALLRTQAGRLWRDRVVLKIPFFGLLKRDYSLSSFSRTLGTTLRSGIPLVEAMRMSRGTLNNLHLEQEMVRAIQRVEEGSSLSDAFSRAGFFPLLALRMIMVGETSGSLVPMLADVADYYEGQVEFRLNRLTTMIEPVLMMVMGLLIAFIIVAMYIPIFQLAGTVA